MRAVRRDVEGVCRQPVVGKVAVQGTLTVAAIAVRIDAYNRSSVAGLILGAVTDTKPRHNLDVLGCVAADLGEVLQFLGRQSKRFFARVHSRYREVAGGGDFDGLC